MEPKSMEPKIKRKVDPSTKKKKPKKQKSIDSLTLPNIIFENDEVIISSPTLKNNSTFFLCNTSSVYLKFDQIVILFKPLEFGNLDLNIQNSLNLKFKKDLEFLKKDKTITLTSQKSMLCFNKLTYDGAFILYNLALLGNQEFQTISLNIYK